MKLINALVVAALVLFAAGVVHADDTSGGDSRIVIGTTPPGSPPCTGFSTTATSGGLFLEAGDNDRCTVGGAPSTSITFATPAADVLGGALTCSSTLSTVDGWSAKSATVTIDGESVDECTFTAPTSVTMATYLALLGTEDPIPFKYVFDPPPTPYNDGDCDLDDLTLGVPVDCDITFDSPKGATIGDTEAFTSDAAVEVSPTGPSGITPFPEPGSLALLLVGLIPLAFMRRRALER